MIEDTKPPIFLVKDCVLSTISTGERAGTLIDFRDKLTTIHEDCIYYHFWETRLRPMFIDPEYHNDFASWAHHTLHDDILAERLGIIDPIDFKDVESLRATVLEVVENRIDEREMLYWAKEREHFHFLRSMVLIFSTPYQMITPLDLIAIVPNMSTHSIFYHFIDARRRSKGDDDFSLWLHSFGEEYKDLIHQIHSIDPYFFTLIQLKKELLKVVQDYFKQ